MHARVYVHMYACRYVCVCVYECTHICMYARTYVTPTFDTSQCLRNVCHDLTTDVQERSIRLDSLATSLCKPQISQYIETSDFINGGTFLDQMCDFQFLRTSLHGYNYLPK